MLGFSEVLTWILCSHDDNFANVSREDDGNCAAIVANPSGLDVQVARSSLLQGVLKAMGANKDAPVPARLFEVGDVVLLDETRDVGARNARRLLVLYSDKKSGLEVWRALNAEFEPQNENRFGGMLQQILNTTFRGLSVEELNSWERQIREYEDISKDTVSEATKLAVINNGLAPGKLQDHLQLNADRYTSYALLAAGIRKYFQSHFSFASCEQGAATIRPAPFRSFGKRCPNVWFRSAVLRLAAPST